MHVSNLARSAVVMTALSGPSADAADRILRAEVDVPASREAVWAAWTTEAGIQTFFAPARAHRAARGWRLRDLLRPERTRRPARWRRDAHLAFEPPRRIAFTWNAPPAQPFVRAQRTVVTLDLAAIDAARTRLRFTHSGWGEGPEWDAAYAYFDSAWNKFVLPSLVRRFAIGPIDWKSRPSLEPVPPPCAPNSCRASRPVPHFRGPRLVARVRF